MKAVGWRTLPWGVKGLWLFLWFFWVLVWGIPCGAVVLDPVTLNNPVMVSSGFSLSWDTTTTPDPDFASYRVLRSASANYDIELILNPPAIPIPAMEEVGLLILVAILFFLSRGRVMRFLPFLILLILFSGDARGITGGAWLSDPITPKATTSYTNQGLSNGSYYYKVYVFDVAGNYVASNEVSGSLVPRVKLPDTGQTGNYSTTFGEDSDYTINPPSYVDNGDGTVTDNVTGLLWQQADDGVFRTWANAGSYYCQALSLGGRTGWRVPNIKELVSIVDYQNINPAINTVYFPGANSYYWSSTSYAGYTAFAWQLWFHGTTWPNNNKMATTYTRCVLGTPYLVQNSFTDNGDGTVLDNGTGLVWQQTATIGQNWEGAIAYCEGLSLTGKTDWRLPNIKELQSIVDHSKFSPAIDTTYFPNGQYSTWSSTAYVNNISRAWITSISNGHVTMTDMSSSFYARCVRGR